MIKSTESTISVGIPAHNAEATIRATLDSVLAQTRPADEVLVIDDGSKDGTAAILESFGSKLKVIRQENRGVGATRNRLASIAKGDLVAFLDADDLWHPLCLESQLLSFTAYPQAAASFVGHIIFSSNEQPCWPSFGSEVCSDIEEIAALQFLSSYNRATGPFLPSCACVRKPVLQELGSEPFGTLRRGEDCYFFNRLPLVGRPVVMNHAPLAAYRRTPGSLSSNKLELVRDLVRVYETLEQEYRDRADDSHRLIFFHAFAGQRSLLGKMLLSTGRIREARIEFKKAFWMDRGWSSRMRRLVLAGSSYLPKIIRPDWLADSPEWKPSEERR